LISGVNHEAEINHPLDPSLRNPKTMGTFIG